MIERIRLAAPPTVKNPKETGVESQTAASAPNRQSFEHPPGSATGMVLFPA